jgi:S-DNA-T family DNA segregation ATPase FtsK/SpoIIIE
MDARYERFAEAGVRDLKGYNDYAARVAEEWDFAPEDYDDLDGEDTPPGPPSPDPQIVIIIDELADLMMVAPGEVEDSICRLAQKARAAGLHLVLATQRPSVNVITGTIKANIPSRISFAVSSQIDSRTILDTTGAEKLLGKGDMLFYPAGASKPTRIQGAFVSDSEIEELVFYIKDQNCAPDYNDGVTGGEPEGKTSDNAYHLADELLEDAITVVIETGQASVSMLQRKFRIGYTRAARLIDTIEEMKIIGPGVGAKPRDILMNLDEVKQHYFKNN